MIIQIHNIKLAVKAQKGSKLQVSNSFIMALESHIRDLLSGSISNATEEKATRLQPRHLNGLFRAVEKISTGKKKGK